MDPRPSDPAASSRAFLRNLGVLGLYMIPGGLVAATTKIRYANGLTYLALFAFLVPKVASDAAAARTSARGSDAAARSSSRSG